MPKQKEKLLAFSAIFGLPLIFFVLLLSLYVVSICWRVSLAEQNEFGRSDLFPLSLHPMQYKQQASIGAYGDSSFTFDRHGTPVIVYKQLTNGFQHAYGSALACYELGSAGADLLFRANEYAESIFAKNSGTRQFYEDTKKDLANNAVGRAVGRTARTSGLRGEAADRFMIKTVLAQIDRDEVLRHWQDPRVPFLQSPEQSGCPFLTLIQKARRGERTDVLSD